MLNQLENVKYFMFFNFAATILYFYTYCFYTYCKPPHPTCHHSPHGHRKPTHSECIDQILIYRPILLVHKFVQLKKIRNWHENTMPISCKNFYLKRYR